MKVLICSLNYYPELTGIGKYSGEMAEWLANEGHDVRVVTAPPYYPEWSIGEGYSAFKYKKELLKNVAVWRCPLYVPKNQTALKRLLHLFSFAFSSSFIMLVQVFWKPTIVICIEPPLFSSPITLVVSWLSRSRSWLHVQDFEVDAAFDLGILSSPNLRKFILKAERWLMNKFDRVSTISERMVERLYLKNVPPERAVLFPNWVDTKQIYPKEAPNLYREQLKIIDSDMVFLYSGNMGEKQGLEIIIEAARLLVDYKNIVIVMCGQGSAYSRLRSLSTDLNNIHWLPLQPIEQLNDLLNMSDVHLLPQREDVTDLVLPSKLTGMLSSGKPIIATSHKGTQISKTIENCGKLVPPGDTDLFAKAIQQFSMDKDQIKRLGNNARTYALEHLELNEILKEFNKELLEL